ncbi:hypothetical protein [Nocardia tengchongensis]|uniref:hypothetical protein n=1 Tax=Nocardia tengchongensis TaxID=2055889 RepID=UPI003669D185
MRGRLTDQQIGDIPRMTSNNDMSQGLIAAAPGTSRTTFQAVANSRSHRLAVARAFPRYITGYRLAVVEHGLAHGQRPVDIADTLQISRQAVNYLMHHSKAEPAYAVTMPGTPVNLTNESLWVDARFYRLTPAAAWSTGAAIGHVIVTTVGDPSTARGPDEPALETWVFECDASGQLAGWTELFGSPYKTGGDHAEVLRRAGYLLVEEVPPPRSR